MPTPNYIPAYAHNYRKANTTLNQVIRLVAYIPFLLLVLFPADSYAQCTRYVREYANVQQSYTSGLLGLLKGTVTNGALAVDNNVATASTLQVDLGILNASHAIQYLKFPQRISANTPVTIKLSLPATLVGVFDNFTIQPFTNLHYNPGGFLVEARWEADAAGAAYNGVNLLNAASGKGTVSITLTPATEYDGIWIDLSSIVAVGASMNIYHAYIEKVAATNLDCEERIDVLSGIRAGTVAGGIANATGGISNPSDPMGTLGTAPWAAVDNDPNYTTYAQLNTGVAVLSEVYHTTIFSTPSIAGDSVQIVLQDPGGILLNLGLLNGVTVQPYLGNTPAGPALDNTGSLLSLRLLPGAGNKYVITAPVSASFDRVEIKIGGVTGALQSIRVYDVRRKIRIPVTNLTLNGMNTNGPVCLNQVAGLAFSVTSTSAETCATYTWHDSATGTPVAGGVSSDGLSFIPPITTAGTYKYYVQLSRNGCTSSTAQSPISITVNALPEEPVIPSVLVCEGQAATLTVSNAAAGTTYTWYADATGGSALSNSISNGTSYTTGVPPLSGYYVEAYNTATTCTSQTRGAGHVTVTLKPGGPALSIQAHP